MIASFPIPPAPRNDAAPPSGLSGLAAWTPVALDLTPPAPWIDWADLRGVRFAEPFFHQTVERWAGGDPRPLVRTGLEALAALDAAPSLDPDLFVFHMSRCGSTLVSRLASCVPGVLAVAEPAPLNVLLMATSEAMNEAARVVLLRTLVRALGRRRFGDERRYLLKLSSWNVCHIALFRRAFPGVPAVWVQREPGAVVASLIADPPGWGSLQRDPRALHRAFGLAPDDAAGDRPAFFTAALAAMLRAIRDDVGPTLVLDYRALPDAVWTDVAPLLGLGLGDEDIARMRDEARFDSKTAGHRVFVARPEAHGDLAEPVRALVAQHLVPLYHAVALR